MRKFYHTNPTKIDEQVDVYAKPRSQHNIVVGMMPRSCKCIVANMKTAVFELPSGSVLMVAHSNLKDSGIGGSVVCDTSDTKEVELVGLYYSNGFYTKEIKKVDKYEEVKIGDTLKSFKHNGREITVVHITNNGSLVYEYKKHGEVVSGIMQVNGQDHTTYPIEVRHL